MSDAKQYHREAMALSHEADAWKRVGAAPEAMALYCQAAQKEALAAACYPPVESSEPTRSILYRSAAWLALGAGELEQARRFAAFGLSGYPSKVVHNELIEVLDKAVIDYHLSTKGIILSEGEAQLMLQGLEVRAGFTFFEPFLRTVEQIGRLAKQKTQELLNLPFSANARPMYTPAIAAFRPGSVAVTFKLAGVPNKHGSLQLPLVTPDQVLDEVVTVLDIWNTAGDEGLREVIEDDNYFDYYRSNAAALAPDGKKLSMVGITTPRGKVVIDRVRATTAPQAKKASDQPFLKNQDGSITVEGELVDASKETGTIHIVPAIGRKWNIEVGEGLIEVVRDCFGKQVSVLGTTRKGRQCLTLKEISPMETE